MNIIVQKFAIVKIFLFLNKNFDFDFNQFMKLQNICASRIFDSSEKSTII